MDTSSPRISENGTKCIYFLLVQTKNRLNNGTPKIHVFEMLSRSATGASSLWFADWGVKCQN